MSVFGVFWSAFFRIWTEYGEIRVSLCIQSECGKISTGKTSNTDNFHAVKRIMEHLNLWSNRLVLRVLGTNVGDPDSKALGGS